MHIEKNSADVFDERREEFWGSRHESEQFQVFDEKGFCESREFAHPIGWIGGVCRGSKKLFYAGSTERRESIRGLRADVSIVQILAKQ